MVPDESKRALSSVRLEHAEQCLSSAKALLEVQDYKGAANRAYYAVFHGMRAVLALDGIDRRHHAGVITEFRRLYIKTGILDQRLSDIIQMQSEYRTSSDYDDFFIISKAEVAEQVETAKEFLKAVKVYLSNLV